MISVAEYARHDGPALAGLVRSGEVSSAELLESAIARIETHSPGLNAVIRKRYEQARIDAAQVNRAALFAGVPFLVKDLIATIAGELTGSGNRLMERVKMPRDSEMVRRYRAAACSPSAGRTRRNLASRRTRNQLSSGQPAIRGLSSIHPAAPAVDRPLRWRRAWFPWPVAATAVARSAFQHRAAAYSGSSPAAAGLRPGRMRVSSGMDLPSST